MVLPSLRERTQQAVRNELIDISQRLFAESGYEQVTIDQIAKATGISRRSFFRYFPSKDALILGKLDRQGESYVNELNARPPEEPLWTALRRMMDGTVAYLSDPELGKRAREFERIVNTSKPLHAGFLQQMENMQQKVAKAAIRRESANGSSMSRIDITVTVAAAFGALQTATKYSYTDHVPMTQALDEAMNALKPLEDGQPS